MLGNLKELLQKKAEVAFSAAQPKPLLVRSWQRQNFCCFQYYHRLLYQTLVRLARGGKTFFNPVSLARGSGGSGLLDDAFRIARASGQVSSFYLTPAAETFACRG